MRRVPQCHLFLLLAAAIFATTATAVVSYGTATVVSATATAEEDEDKDDNPRTISTKTIITHIKDLLFCLHNILCYDKNSVTKENLNLGIDFS